MYYHLQYFFSDILYTLDITVFCWTSLLFLNISIYLDLSTYLLINLFALHPILHLKPPIQEKFLSYIL